MNNEKRQDKMGGISKIKVGDFELEIPFESASLNITYNSGSTSGCPFYTYELNLPMSSSYYFNSKFSWDKKTVIEVTTNNGQVISLTDTEITETNYYSGVALSDFNGFKVRIISKSLQLKPFKKL